jgi:hypothetical protein
MYIVDDGIYRINKIDFTNAGITTGTIDPRTVKVYYKGNQIPIYFNGESDGVFDDSDYFDFYGQRNYGGLTNAYNSNGGGYQVVYTSDEYFNQYSDTNSYWIGWGGAYGLRFTDYTFSSGINFSPNYFYKKLHFEQDNLYSFGQNIDANDFNNFNNERYQGEGWFWMPMYILNTLTQNFTTPYLSPNLTNCKFKVFAYPGAQNLNLTNEHSLIVTINNVLVDTIYTTHFNRIDTTIFFPSTLLNSAGNNQIKIKYFTSDPNMGLLFDMFEIQYSKSFIFDTSRVSFMTGSTDSTSKIFKISNYIPGNGINIYDVKNGFRIINNTINADTLIFSGKGDGNFEVINSYITKKPFRIKQRSVPNLVTNSTGADYLVIYNKLFETQAEQLRAYRNSHDGYRSFKAEMEDIYDIFNYGIENPIAVRNFVRNTYNIWTAPKLKFICLFGRGSIDPKRNNPASIYYQNFVPVYGVPPTDGYFSNLNVGTFSYYQQIPIGRLPAYTVQEAQDMVNKIMGYESQSLDTWMKKTIMISGGYYTDDQLLYSGNSETILTSYLIPGPLALNPTRIYLQDPSGLVTYNYADSVKNSINRGALFMNYIGKGGNGYWDYCYDNTNVYSNGYKLPLIYSYTCYTGKDAESTSRGFGEGFITSPNKGAIGFISTTGWAFYPTGLGLDQQFASLIRQDTSRRIGSIYSKASMNFGTGSDSANYNVINSVNCFNLLGDPAVKLLLPKYPEFDITLSDYNISNLYPTVKENVNLAIYPKNLGTLADSCKVRIQITKNNLNYKIKDTILRTFGYIDTINYNFSMDSTGMYDLKVILDADNWYPLENKLDNIINIPVSVKNVAFVPLKPIDNSVVKTDTVTFVGINPNISPLKFNIKLLLQLDTTSSFTSPMLATYFNNNMTGVQTKFKVRIPILDSNIVYYWRLNMVKNSSDTSGWSQTCRFIYNNNIVQNLSVSKNTKHIQQDTKSNINLIDSIITVFKSKVGQYNLSDLNSVSFDPTGIKLNKFTGNIIANSFSIDPWAPTYISIFNNSIELLGPANMGGFHVAKVKKLNGSLLDLRHFVFTSSTSSDSLLNFLNTFDTTNILMIVKVPPVDYTNEMNEATKSKLITLGSIYVDSVTQAAWDRWSFISYISNTNQIVSENFLPYNVWATVMSTMQPVFQATSGTITHLIGPSESWKNFSWQQVLNPNSTIKFDVIGINRSNQEVTILSDLTTNNFVDISSINAYQYPNLKLVAKLNLDSISGSQSPVFKSLNFKYIPPGEIALDNNSYLQSDSIVNNNDTIGLSLTYYNIGYSDFNGVVRNFFVYNNNGQKVILRSDTIMSILKIDSASYLKTKFPIAGIPNFRRYNNSVDFNVEVQPFGQQNDYYYYNNSAVSNIVVKNILKTQSLEVLSDGVKLINGDFVRSKPDLVFKFNDMNFRYSGVFDTTSLRLFINNSYIPYNILNPDKSILKVENKTISKNSPIIIRCNPTLPDGQNNFKFFMLNSEGSNYDTVKYDVLVSNQLLVKDLSNYPNPMKNKTDFIFNLGGDKTPTSCKIKIYTVAGRLIKLIDSPVIIGFNKISWDGRDQDGDYIANGVYLYKIIIQGESQTETAIQKLAILK